MVKRTRLDAVMPDYEEEEGDRSMQDDKAFLAEAIARIDRRSEELARPQPEPISSIALLGLAVLAAGIGIAIFGAGMLLRRWLG